MKKITSLAIVWEQIEWGGVESYLSYLLNNKNFEKIKVTIFSNKNNKGLKRFVRLNKNTSLKIIRYSSLLNLEFKNMILKKIYYFIKPILFIFTYFQLKNLIGKVKFDVYLGVCGGYGQIRGEMAGALCASKLNIPVISLGIHHACVFPPPFMNFFVSIINNRISKIISSVIAVSEATKKTLFYKSNLLDNDKVDTVVIHHGISNKSKKITNINHEKNNNKIIEIGIISRIEEYKGHRDLIHAIDKLPKNYLEKIKINIIGDGKFEEMNNLKSLVKSYDLKNIFFRGYIDKPIGDIISELDLILSLTRSFEGFGLSMLEGATMGIPIIATDVGAVEEFLDKNYSLIIKPSSPEDIKEKLIEFIDNRLKWTDHAKKYRDIILSRFNEDKMVEQYINHFNQKFNTK
jgi:glycosyltransferase involved in cell wall biosynthesis